MSEPERVALDEVLLAVVRDEFDYREQNEVFFGQDRATLLAMAPEQRLAFMQSVDQVRELILPEIEWWRLTIPAADLDACYYPDDAPWRDFTGRTQLVRDGAQGLDALDPFHSARVESTLDSIREGHGFEPLVLTAARLDGPRVIVHGETRATAFVRLYNPAREVAVFLGIGEGVTTWPWWPSQAAS